MVLVKCLCVVLKPFPLGNHDIMGSGVQKNGLPKVKMVYILYC